MTTSISQKIDSYAKAHLKELKQEEAQTGKKLTKYDIAQKMLSSGKLSQSDFASWMGTNEGFQSQQKSKVSIFASQTPFTESYLDTMTDTIEIAGMKYEDTPKNRALKEQSKSNLRKLNKQVKEFTKDTKLTDADKNKTVSEMTREIDAQIENQRFSQMTHDARKKHIVSKFLSAYDQNDKGAMMSALGEFNSYMCQYIDDKLGITDAKQSIKEFVHLDKLVEYIDKNVDDGTDAITFMEGLWEFTKGVGDAVDSFIGSQGLEMAGVLGTASKAIQSSGKLAPVLGGAMQAYFGVEGTMLMADGTEKIVNAETKEDVRAGGSEVGMGAIMTGGAVGSVRSGVKGRKVQQEQAKFENMAKDVANQYPEVSQRLAEYKTPDGKPLFTKEEINSVLVNCKKTIESNPDKLFAILNNPKEIADIVKCKNKAAGLWRAVNEPFPSTIEANPEVFGVKPKAKTEPAKPASKPTVTADMSIEAMKELAKTPEGVRQLEEAGLIITKNTVSKLENVYEGQSQSPARRIKKLDLTGTPEEVVAKNPGLKYDADQGKFFREVSWDGGKTMERMYVDASDPKGYFMIQYGKEPWDGALLGGTEAAKSYVEPNAYNATGAKNYLKPEEMGYEWTEASKAAPVRFAEVPEGVKGIVGKEGFQPITGSDQVIAIDVKGQPYINTADYVRNNTKGLSQDAVKVLDKVEGKTVHTAPAKPSISQELKAQLTDALKDVEYDKNEVLTMIDKYPDVVTRLAEYKTPNGESLFKPIEINDILFNCKKTIESNPDKLFAILNNPEEIASIMGYKNRAVGLWRAVDDPFQSTIEANPEVFGVKTKAKTEPTKTTEATAPAKTSVSKELKEELYDSMFFSDYYPNKITTEDISLMITKYPEVITRLAECKTPEGELLIGYHKIIDFCFDKNIQKVLDSNPQKLFAILDNPREMTAIIKAKSPIARIQRALLAESRYPEFMNKLSEYNTPDGQQLFDYVELTSRILNPNKKYAPEVFELLDNPRDISYIKSLKYEDRAGAIKNALYLTGLKDGTSPISRILRSQLEGAPNGNKVWDMIDKYPEVVAKLAEYKAPNGEPLFKPAEINGILFNCKKTIENNPQAMYDILDNPQSRVNLSGDENKAFGLFKMLYY